MLVLALLLQDPADLLRQAAPGNYEATHKRFADLGLKDVAAAFKAAVHCGACRNGKVTCPDCEGRGRRDLPCGKCQGVGRHKPEGGVVGSVDVTVKCRNCDGLRVFKNAGCPGCGRSGLAACGGCMGSPWRDRHCALKECRGGKVPCPDCKGKGKVLPPCAPCSGLGRIETNVSVKCRGCEGKGRASLEQACATCAGKPEGLGRVRCPGEGFTLKLEPCEPCAGCFRLGLRFR
jgi:hypothetical protein